MALGNLFYNHLPLSPSTILWINYLMDTVSAIIFASVYPKKQDLTRSATKYSQIEKSNSFHKVDSDDNFLRSANGRKHSVQYTSILDMTEPFPSKASSLLNQGMILNIVASTIYQ